MLGLRLVQADEQSRCAIRSVFACPHESLAYQLLAWSVMLRLWCGMTIGMASPSDVPPISGLVPMIRVADVDRSAAFYRRLGFEIGNYVPPTGTKQWAWLYAPKAADWKRGPNLMVTRSDEAIDASRQAVLFYLYAADLKSLRDELLAGGVAASEIKYPDYLPNGECRVGDPDGYTLMIAQAADDTP